jgi:hypothetical protein
LCITALSISGKSSQTQACLSEALQTTQTIGLRWHPNFVLLITKFAIQECISPMQACYWKLKARQLCSKLIKTVFFLSNTVWLCGDLLGLIKNQMEFQCFLGVQMFKQSDFWGSTCDGFEFQWDFRKTMLGYCLSVGLQIQTKCVSA